VAVKVLGQPSSLGAILADLSVPHNPLCNPIYFLAGVSGVLFAPPTDLYGMACAVYYRTTRDVTEFGTHDPEVWDRWLYVAEAMAAAGAFPFCVGERRGAREMIMESSSGKRLWDALVRANEEGPPRMTKSYNLKANETLGAGKAPRTIASIEPYILAMTAPWSRSMTTVLKNHWDGSFHFSAGGRSCVMLYCAGLGIAEVLRRVNFLSAHSSAFLVAGDDMLMHHRALLLESDASMCDITLGAGPLLYADFVVMKSMGLPVDVINVLMDISRVPIVVLPKASNGFLSVQCKLPPQNCTGTTITSVGTTWRIAMVNVYHMVYSPHDDLRSSALDMGMSFKVKVVTWEQATFLRCHFIRNQDGALEMTNLPSLMLKICKVMKDPVALTRLPVVQAYQQYAYGLSRSIFVSRRYPMLGAMLRLYDRMGRDHGVQVDAHESNWEYKLQPGPLTADVGAPGDSRAQAVSFIFERYGLTMFDIVEIEALFDAVDVLPCLVAHPAFARLAEVDYS
jgi:hypothetical protein